MAKSTWPELHFTEDGYEILGWRLDDDLTGDYIERLPYRPVEEVRCYVFGKQRLVFKLARPSWAKTLAALDAVPHG